MLGARLYGEIRNLQFEKQFERDFMRRTLKLVQEYQGPYDATLLLNCLLGLLIVPKEISREQIPTDPISKLKDWGISPGSIKRVGKKNDKNQHPETLRGIVYNLRNWIAHIRVKPTGDKQAGEGVYVYRQERIRGNNRSR